MHSVFGDGIIQDVQKATSRHVIMSVLFANNDLKRLGSSIFSDPTVITSLTASQNIWCQVARHKKDVTEQLSPREQWEAEQRRQGERFRKENARLRQEAESARREIELRRLEEERAAKQRRQEKAREFEQRRLEKERQDELKRQEEEKARRELEQQRAREAESAAEFAQLKRKYFAATYKDRAPISRLFPILQSIDQSGVLSKDDLAWLEEEKLAGPLACYFEWQYQETGQPHLLARACGYWRQCRKPERVLDLTMNLDSIQSRNSRAVLFTTRGGAFRDLNSLEDAEHCANQAISLRPHDSHPYRLRGAVLFQRGQPDQGYEDFLEADRLDKESGLQRDDTTRKDMETALKRANLVDRKHVAHFLIQVDPVKYEWARYYLDHPQDENR